MALTEYAWAERYVVPGGAGANNGLSFADAFDVTQVAGNLLQGRRFNFSGTFNLASNLSWVLAGSGINPIGFLGWKGDQSAPVDSFGDIPIFNGGGSGFNISLGPRQLWKGLRHTSGTAMALSGTDNVSIDFCEWDNFSGNAIDLDNYIAITRSRIHDNGGWGFSADLGISVFGNEIYDNAGDGIVTGGNGWTIAHNLITRNSDGISSSATSGGRLIALNTIDGNSLLGIASSTDGPNYILANQITNNTGNATGVDDGVMFLYNNLFGNGGDGSSPHFLENTTYVNPQYVNMASNDYEIQNTDLMNVAVPLLGVTTIGAWQPTAGGGAAGGLLVHPGMSGGMRG